MAVRGADNISELSDVPSEKLELFSKAYQRPVTDIRVNDTKWVILRYPNASMAQAAGTSLEAFEDFYFHVCNLEASSRMAEAMSLFKN